MVKVHLVKAMVFPTVFYGYESWTIKKAECQRIDAFELWCWTTRRSNQSILNKISPEYSLEGLMLKLKVQYFGHLMQRTDSLEKTLILGKIKGRRTRGLQRTRWLGLPGVRHNWATKLQRHGTCLHQQVLSLEVSWLFLWRPLCVCQDLLESCTSQTQQSPAEDDGKYSVITNNVPLCS